MTLPDLGLLVWWSTNTRSAAVITHLAAQNRIPLYLVVDPDASSPGRQVSRHAIIRQRSRAPVEVGELESIAREAIDELDVSRILLCPTSEYIQQVAHSELQEAPQIELLPTSEVSYALVSSKEWLVTEGPRHGLRVPRTFEPTSSSSSLPFVAKPRVNIVGSAAIRPFLVDSESEWERFKQSSGSYFAEEFIPGPSHYWCAYRSRNGELATYFQSNILQRPGGESITYARRTASRHLSQDLTECAKALESFVHEIGYRGPIMAELRNGVVTEINPRFWGPLMLDSTTGARILKAFVHDVFDQDVQTKFPKTSTYVVPSILAGSVRSGTAIRASRKAGKSECLLAAFARFKGAWTREFQRNLGGDY